MTRRWSTGRPRPASPRRGYSRRRTDDQRRYHRTCAEEEVATAAARASATAGSSISTASLRPVQIVVSFPRPFRRHRRDRQRPIPAPARLQQPRRRRHPRRRIRVAAGRGPSLDRPPLEPARRRCPRIEVSRISLNRQHRSHLPEVHGAVEGYKSSRSLIAADEPLRAARQTRPPNAPRASESDARGEASQGNRACRSAPASPVAAQVRVFRRPSSRVDGGSHLA